MRAVIMAAGKGTRMLPLTETIPKVLIEINEKPFLYYVFKNLQKAGYDDFGIIVGYKKEKFPEFLKKYKFKATLIEQKEQLGTGHAVMQAKGFCKDENFVVLGGDNLFSVQDLKAINNQDEFCYAVGKELEGDVSKYGVFLVEDNKLRKIIEKPKKFISNLINVGLYKFTPEIWNALDKIKPSERGEYEVTDAITILAQQGKVKALKLKDYWLDLGCKKDIPKVEAFLKKCAE